MRIVAEITAFLVRYRRWLIAFGLLHGLDLILTWALISGGTAYEANPFAARLLAEYGWWGLAGLKFLSILLVIITAIFMARRHVSAPVRLLRWTCGITGVVVAYSLFLMVQARAEWGPEHWLENEQERGAALERRWLQTRQYRREVDRLARSIITGHTSLVAAVKALTPCVERLQPDPLARMSNELSDLSAESRAAVYLLNAVGYLVREHPLRSRLLYDRLRQEFVAHYGEPASYAVQWFAPGRPGGARPPLPNRGYRRIMSS